MNHSIRTRVGFPAWPCPSAAFSTAAWAWTFTLYGVTLAAGGWHRFPTGLAYGLRDIPHAPLIVGCLFVLAGLTSAVGQAYRHFRLRNLGLTTLIVLLLALAGAAAYAAASSPDAGPGIAIIYAGLALQLAILRRLKTRRVGGDRDAPDR
jgi:hypothetical protein